MGNLEFLFLFSKIKNLIDNLEIINIRKKIGPTNKGIDLGLLGKLKKNVIKKNINVKKNTTLDKKIIFDKLKNLIVCKLIFIK